MDLLPQEQTLLYQSYVKIAAAGPELTKVFYARLFEQNPQFQSLFTISMLEQGIKWRMMLSMLVTAIDNPAKLKSTLRDLGRRHAQYGVKIADYSPFVEAILWAMRQYLGSEFTLEVQSAWQKLFAIIVDLANDH